MGKKWQKRGEMYAGRHTTFPEFVPPHEIVESVVRPPPVFPWNQGEVSEPDESNGSVTSEPMMAPVESTEIIASPPASPSSAETSVSQGQLDELNAESDDDRPMDTSGVREQLEEQQPKEAVGDLMKRTWYNPYRAGNEEPSSMEISTAPLRRPIVPTSGEVAEVVGQIRQMEKELGVESNDEIRDSLEAEQELRAYLEQKSPTRNRAGADTHRSADRSRSPCRKSSSRNGPWLDVRSEAPAVVEENWDEEMDETQPSPLVLAQQRAKERADKMPPKLTKGQKKQAKGFNPRRQPVADDYEPRWLPSRSEVPSPEPGIVDQQDSGVSEHVRRDTSRQGGNNGTLPPRTRGVMFGGLVPIPTDRRIDPPLGVCFNCWQPGHRQSQCPRPKVRMFCRNCGQDGVDLTTCPRCSAPHRQWIEENFAQERAIEREIERHNQESLRRERMAEEARRLEFAQREQARREKERQEYERREHARRLKEAEQMRFERMIRERAIEQA